MINAATNLTTLLNRPWIWLPPGLCILVTVLCINLIGDGLRDAFDPRTKRIPSARVMRKAEADLAARRSTPSDEGGAR